MKMASALEDAEKFPNMCRILDRAFPDDKVPKQEILTPTKTLATKVPHEKIQNDEIPKE